MNRGIARGIDGRPRQASFEAWDSGTVPGSGSQPRMGPLVWYSTRQIGNCIADATALTADKTWSLTLGLADATSQFDRAGIPMDGSVVGLSVLMIARSSVVSATDRLFITDYHQSAIRIGDAVSGNAGVEMYTGKVANHYNSVWVPLVYTGGVNNLQFKYAADWSSGTLTIYLRATGYWVRADEP